MLAILREMKKYYMSLRGSSVGSRVASREPENFERGADQDTRAEIPLATMKREELQWMSQWSEDEELFASGLAEDHQQSFHENYM